MKSVLLSLGLAACAGPTQAQLANTHTATTPRAPDVAPAASDSDADREQMVQSNSDMRDAQQARKEATQGSSAPPKPPLPGQPKSEPASPDKPPGTSP